MKLIYDRNYIKTSKKLNAYDERNLAKCKCGKHRYPSKLMFIEFLKQFKDVPGTADIWSIRHNEDGSVEIHVDVKYYVTDAEPKLSDLKVEESKRDRETS
jgi:hypothetical protein